MNGSGGVFFNPSAGWCPLRSRCLCPVGCDNLGHDVRWALLSLIDLLLAALWSVRTLRRALAPLRLRVYRPLIPNIYQIVLTSLVQHVADRRVTKVHDIVEVLLTHVFREDLLNIF
jgi:hypothetical protein